MNVSISLPDSTEEVVRKQLFGDKQKEDCADGDGVMPIISIEISEKYIKDWLIEWFKWEIIKWLYVGWRTKEIRFNPNWASISSL